MVKEYAAYLPVSDATPDVSLSEGNTPLISVDNLAQHLGVAAKWYVKFEGANPTGSFKDRGMCMAVAKAKEEGHEVIICASTGNTSASAAAYAAKANMSLYGAYSSRKNCIRKIISGDDAWCKCNAN